MNTTLKHTDMETRTQSRILGIRREGLAYESDSRSLSQRLMLISKKTLVAALLACISCGMHAQTTDCQALREAMPVYLYYQSKYPHHFQSVGAAEYADGSCLFVISEPTLGWVGGVTSGRYLMLL